MGRALGNSLRRGAPDVRDTNSAAVMLKHDCGRCFALLLPEMRERVGPHLRSGDVGSATWAGVVTVSVFGLLVLVALVGACCRCRSQDLLDLRPLLRCNHAAKKSSALGSKP